MHSQLWKRIVNKSAENICSAMLLFILCHPELCDIISRKFRCSTLFSVLMLFDAFDVLCLWLTSYGWWLTLNGWPFCFWLALKVLRVLSGRWSAIQLLLIKCSGKIRCPHWRVEETKTHYLSLKVISNHGRWLDDSAPLHTMHSTMQCIVHILFTKWIYQIYIPYLSDISLTLCFRQPSKSKSNLSCYSTSTSPTVHPWDKGIRTQQRSLKMASGAVKRSVGIIRPQSTALFLCDMQEKFAPNIKFFPQIVSNSSR